MKATPSLRSSTLTVSPSTLIPNYELVRQDAPIPRIERATAGPQLLFLRDPQYKFLRETLPLPEKRLLDIPCERRNNWSNYFVHSMHPDYLESWRDDCKHLI